MQKQFLLQALDLATTRRGFCAPNPSVGCLIVNNDEKIIGQGAHQAAGQPHAEIEALQKAQQDPKGATLYVTLEPCCHFGRTPPCVKAIIDAGISKVYFGYLDPNSKVAGQGQQQLQQAGIDCELIPLEAIKQFYRAYRKWILTGKPWVTVKIALSLDGKIADRKHRPVAISGLELQQYTHQQRLHSDAILTTINTIINDDPAFNVRLNNEVIAKPVYVLDSQLRLPADAKLNQTAAKIHLLHAGNHKKSIPNHCHAQVSHSIEQAIEIIGTDGVHHLWVEAGATCLQTLIHSGEADTLIFYLAPKTLGSEALSAFTLQHDFTSNYPAVSTKQFGNDVLLRLDRLEPAA